MRSQTKWGIFFILLALVIFSFTAFYPLTAVYSVILLLLGIALIIFRKREEVIEEV